jgi:hypothetical protein
MVKENSHREILVMGFVLNVVGVHYSSYQQAFLAEALLVYPVPLGVDVSVHFGSTYRTILEYSILAPKVIQEISFGLSVQSYTVPAL